jgi:hypothetical protein
MGIRRRGVPDWVYYAVAVLITLPTLPVYWYFFTHRSSGDQPAVSPQPVSVQRSVPVSRHPVPFYAYGDPLPAGYVCSAADGLVYRRHMAGGADSIDLLYRDGQPVRCAGDRRSSVHKQMICMDTGYLVEIVDQSHWRMTDIRCSAFHS